MKNNIFLKILIFIAVFFMILYLLFLLLPLFFAPFSDKLLETISSEVSKTGFKVDINELKLITTPKLTAGVKVGEIKVFQPDGKELFLGENFKAKMSLIPLLFGKIEADIISADSVNLNLIVKKDGTYKIVDFIQNIEQDEKTAETPQNQTSLLPFNLKLSNKLPDIRVKSHNISFTDETTGKKYSLTGSNTDITGIVFNKKIKISSVGKLTLDGYEAFTYDVKLLNKIMPDIDINDFITLQGEAVEETKPENNIQFNITDAFKALKQNGVKANLVADVTSFGTADNVNLKGKLVLDKMTLISGGKPLPESNMSFDFNNNKSKLDLNFYTAANENTKLAGTIVSGKNPNIDLNCKSNATLNSIFNLVGVFAKVAGIKELETLTGSGKLDVDFNIKSNLKKLASSGYLKLSGGYINYGLYNVKIDNIKSDISIDNNNLLINNLGFSVSNTPLTVKGKISSDAVADIAVNTSKLPIKGLLISFGQGALLKDNKFNSGDISLQVNVKDKLTAPKITGKVSVTDLNLKNIPSDTSILLNPLSIDLASAKSGFQGDIKSSDVKIVNPALTAVLYSPAFKIDEKKITMNKTKVLFGKNNLTLSGEITDYMSPKVILNFLTEGALNSTLTGNIDLSKSNLNLKYSVLNEGSIVIPMFDKSKAVFTGGIDILGRMENPVLKGTLNLSSINIPEIPVSMKNAVLNLNGTILKGNANVAQFTSGTIVANDIKTDLKLIGNDFYLNNLKGSAFGGNFAGDVIYNIVSGACKVKFSGKNMDALKAIEGAAGIKNALTGTLGFNADISFKGVEYNDMMKTLKGSADFDVEKGYLANLGGLNKLLFAQNIVKNALLSAAAQSVSNSTPIKNASKFEYIKGNMTFSGGNANISKILLSGNSMAYYVSGRYNLLNGTTNVTILGRLSESIVSGLGNIGNLAMSKVTSLIPSLGNLTSSLLKAMNESPKNYNLSLIPSLTPNAPSKPFVVLFNGGIDSSSSVKSFKWLNDVDTSALDAQNAAIQEKVQSVQNQINQTKDTLKNTVEAVKSVDKEQVKEKLKEGAKNQAKDFMKSLLTQPQASN